MIVFLIVLSVWIVGWRLSVWMLTDWWTDTLDLERDDWWLFNLVTLIPIAWISAFVVWAFCRERPDRRYVYRTPEIVVPRKGR